MVIRLLRKILKTIFKSGETERITEPIFITKLGKRIRESHSRTLDFYYLWAIEVASRSLKIPTITLEQLPGPDLRKLWRSSSRPGAEITHLKNLISHKTSYQGLWNVWLVPHTRKIQNSCSRSVRMNRLILEVGAALCLHEPASSQVGKCHMLCPLTRSYWGPCLLNARVGNSIGSKFAHKHQFMTAGWGSSAIVNGISWCCVSEHGRYQNPH